ncbi:HAD family hydrolase [uncultured Methylobacterium sp.]|uniref:HAD family hydrolase n=1 Tax=uncultured Methylobacterium sp. TaxID=157278 RepID=UPI00262BF866|nr:HAD family hydrolase [uncultured Methylobacterium sp.]
MPAPRLGAVLFDKDGTLLDYRRTWEPINREAATLAAGGDPVLARRLLAAGGMDPDSGETAGDSVLAAGSTDEIARAWIAAGAAFAPEALTRALDDLFTRRAADAVPAADLDALFGALAGAGLVIGVASSDGEAAVRAMLRRFGLDGVVAFVAGYDSGHGTKPGPGMLLAFARATGLSPSRIAVVGDNLHDIAMARAGGAGLAVGVLTGTGRRASLAAAADHCLGSVADLVGLLAATEGEES